METATILALLMFKRLFFINNNNNMEKFNWANIAGVSLHLPENINASSISIKGDLFRICFVRNDWRHFVYGHGCDDFQSKLIEFALIVQFLKY